MNNVKKIVILLLVLNAMTGFAWAAGQQGKPDATLQLSGGSFAAGIGLSWAKGTLTYQGKDYPVSVNGLSLAKVGISSTSASEEVYNLKKLQDFDGHYVASGPGGRGVTVAGGHTAVTIKNQNGVRVLVTSTTRGVDVTASRGGVDMRIKR
ncbi:MAG: hypothetical protein DME92_00455 [Verrucomicrobia bacterium]|nr:MAG: hypothetical protein DME92_00455 [Verrucomicrobiota bacterium]